MFRLQLENRRQSQVCGFLIVGNQTSTLCILVGIAQHLLQHSDGGLVERYKGLVKQSGRGSTRQRGNQAKGEVIEVSYYGSDTMFYVKLAGTGKVVRVQNANTSRRLDESEKFTWGDQVYVSWTSESIVPLYL